MKLLTISVTDTKFAAIAQGAKVTVTADTNGTGIVQFKTEAPDPVDTSGLVTQATFDTHTHAVPAGTVPVSQTGPAQ